MGERIYKPTEKQIKKWSEMKPATMPTDDEFKALWKKSHHGVERGWGIGKRDWIAAHYDDSVVKTFEYQWGVWEGRVDALNEREKRFEIPTSNFEFGYIDGYKSFNSFWNGYNLESRQDFIKKYKTEE